MPCPPPGDLPDPGVEPASLLSPALAACFFTTSTTWEGHGGDGGSWEICQEDPEEVCHYEDSPSWRPSPEETLKAGGRPPFQKRSNRSHPKSAGDFPGRPVIKTLHFQCRGHRFDPWVGYWDPTFGAAIRNKKKSAGLTASRDMSCVGNVALRARALVPSAVSGRYRPGWQEGPPRAPTRRKATAGVWLCPVCGQWAKTLQTLSTSQSPSPRPRAVLTGHLDLRLSLQQSTHSVTHEAAVEASVGAVQAGDHVPGGR